jgi:hypothetical protein
MGRASVTTAASILQWLLPSRVAYLLLPWRMLIRFMLIATAVLFLRLNV